MRVFVELLRKRVGSPLSLASLARDLAVSPTTLRRYLDILAALYVVIVVKGDGSVRFENAVAVLLQHRMHQLADRGVAGGAPGGRALRLQRRSGTLLRKTDHTKTNPIADMVELVVATTSRAATGRPITPVAASQ